MLLMNAGVPVIFIEYPAMIMALVAVILVEYYVLKRWRWNLAPVLWSNVASTLVGIPLSTIARLLFEFAVPGARQVDPFGASVVMGGQLKFQGQVWIVYLIILLFDYIFSVIIEFFIYRYTYRQMLQRDVWKKTALANAISYFLLIALLPSFYMP